ncbi:hypothetical protein [Microvirga aerophila]|uniref:Uncharacterized protein n=1 Tax=Microvirga aerophila TaxID=670291 RepID=A0A512C184_9HYPH|nr:hypothetical protein [Microvirga aerophila]GEO17969.1 hypothetical protein MAE02_56650 [Microvirga aerophila]
MTPKTFAETIDNRLGSIELAVDAIAKESSEAELQKLRVLVVDVMSWLGRDPGVEAAADDLYAAASALVVDSSVGSQPLARKLRLLKDASMRFRIRLLGAAERRAPKELPTPADVPSVYVARGALGNVWQGFDWSQGRLS